MGMHDDSRVPAPSREPHHVMFDTALVRLEESVDGLGGLLDRMSNPKSAGMPANAVKAAPTLSEFLHGGADRVTKLRQRLDELVSAITVELF